MTLSPELALLIKAALGGHNAPFAVAPNQVDWGKLEKQAKWNQVRPLLFESLSNHPETEPDEAIMQSLKDFSFGQAVANMAFSSISIKLYEQLADANVSAFLMKGALWAWMFYEKPGLREFGDIDFFIDKNDIRKSLAVFLKNGFQPDEYRHYLLSNQKTAQEYLDTDYQLPLTPIQENTLQSLEIQWNCTYPRYLYDLSWPELTRNLMDSVILGTQVKVPPMEYQLLMMVVHHAGIEQWDKLKYMADFVRLLKHSAGSLDWQYVVRVARENGFYNLLMESLGVADLLAGEDYRKLANPDNTEHFPSNAFLTEILTHWEEARSTVKSKSMRILLYNLRHRDGVKTKSRILKAHLAYISHWQLIRNKWMWYRKG